MDDELKSDTSYGTQVIPRPVQLFCNLCCEESMSKKSMTSLNESSTELLWEHGETDVSQAETIFTLFDLHISTESSSDESDGPVSPTFTSSPKVHKVLICFVHVIFCDSLTFHNKTFVRLVNNNFYCSSICDKLFTLGKCHGLFH